MRKQKNLRKTFFIRDSNGFTLQELLIAMMIVAILSVIGFSTFKNIQKKALEYRIGNDFREMEVTIQLARQEHSQTLDQLLDAAPGGGGAEFDFTDQPCRGKLSVTLCNNTILDAWKIVTGKSSLTIADLPTDPWGHIYVFDANEQESSFFWPALSTNKVSCRYDILKSAGPDGIISDTGFSGGPNISWDDYIFYVSPFRCKTQEEVYCTPGTVLGGKRVYSGACSPP
jgi:prepilin-type N-terminal cleavage/methylation domain-containing protein